MKWRSLGAAAIENASIHQSVSGRVKPLLFKKANLKLIDYRERFYCGTESTLQNVKATLLSHQYRMISTDAALLSSKSEEPCNFCSENQMWI
ncbi:hypothetical protein NPIL_532521 [Nephila pilipes]|uniref:Uncharacterized protein n=1 Tax=Nephila pilipes TaxID=299642 RepID=A0A8X6IV45_NEPPI|nr:hypothetical protein NPIL_532521 [Nephila pilipes]